MRVLFVLPAPVRVPMGGAAVVYRHAETLAARGHHVVVAAPRRGAGMRGRALRVAVQARDRLHGVEDVPLYAAAGVETREVATAAALDVYSFDSVIATGHQTASWVLEAIARAPGWRGEGLYFIQHDERYLSPTAEATWSLPLRRIVVATWLADVLRARGSDVAAVVPNAIDPDVFYPARAVEGRARRVVALYHRLAVKGPDTLVEALERLRAAVPDAEADILAARPPRHRLPAWASVHVRPDLEALTEIYNQASICLHTSRLEGWGLVPMEAAACGCAVVATASRGVAEYLVADRSMLQVGVGDASALAAAAASLLRDDARRVAIAQAGLDDVARFRWSESTDRLEAVLQGRP